ncbi:hypothetical protein KAU11_09365 [Candidatus Babeliales bacterium]|nr:hypothetical protein [Candidatus Babeliales bacterium]
MVNRITFVEVADDDTLSAGYFNDLRSKTLLNRDSSAQDTTEYSATIGGGLDWVDLGYSKTFTPIDGVNNILKSLNVEWDLKVDSIASIYRVKIVNDTTSEIFYAYNAFGADDAGIETQTLDRETSTT